MAVPEPIANLVGQVVVVDTDSHMLYIGKLAKVGDDFLELAEADVHSHLDSHSSREVYIMDARKLGIRQNRTGAIVLMSRVVSISRLEDVTDY
jgi:hypothetical protein